MVKINQKLIFLIHSLTVKEIEEFSKFVSSPFFTKGRNYLPFLEQVLKIKNGENKTSEVSLISNDGKKLSDQTLRNRYSELYYLGEEFLAYKGFTENKAVKDKILLEKLLEKKLYKLFKTKYTKILKHLENEKFDDVKFKNLSDISAINSLFLHDKNKVELLYREFYHNSNIVLCLNLLNLFETGLEFAQQQIDNRTYDPNFVFDFLRRLEIKDIMETFKKSGSVILKVTSMNYFLYCAFENLENENYYFEAHKIFLKLNNELKDSYKIKFFTFLINYCIKKQNLGITKYQLELFRLYNEKLNQNLIEDLKSNKYTFNSFRDYVYIGMTLKEYGWVENFIKKYSGELPPEIREDETGLSYAKLNFSKKKFTESLSDLANIKTSNYLIYLDSSLIKLCNYFELAKYDEAYLEIDKHKHYIKNHKEIPKDRVRYSNNFITIYQKLLKISLEPEKEDPGLLEKEINELDYIDKNEWIKRKILDLKIRNSN